MRLRDLVSASIGTALLSSCASSLIFTGVLAVERASEVRSNPINWADYAGLAVATGVIAFGVTLMALLLVAVPLTRGMRNAPRALRAAVLIVVGTVVGAALVFLLEPRLFRSTFPLPLLFGSVASLSWVLLLPHFTRRISLQINEDLHG